MWNMICLFFLLLCPRTASMVRNPFLDCLKAETDRTTDGGGVRGLSELLILKRLMHHIRAESKDHKLPKPCDYFDVIYGTSTGGLIAIMLGRLELDIDECIRWYTLLSKRIFPKKAQGWSATIKKYWSAWKEKEWFDSGELEACIKEVIASKLGSNRVDELLEGSDSRCKIAVCVTRGETRKATFLRSYYSQIDTPKKCTIWQAARATSAAPLFFAPITIGSLGSIYADGGIRNNNPTFAMLTQVQKDPIFGITTSSPNSKVPNTIACIVSIGTGKMETKGLGSDLKAVIEACVDLVTDTEDAARLFEDQHQEMVLGKRYFRFNVEQGLQKVGLEEGDKLNLMEAATDDYLNGQTRELNDCAALLREPSPPPYNTSNYVWSSPSSFAKDVSLRELRLWLDFLPEYDHVWQNVTSGVPHTAQGDLQRNLSYRYERTCEWIKRRREYQTWLSTPASRSIWVNGIPGCGKSVLAASVAQEQQLASPTLVFFCDSKDQRKLSASGVLRNLLVQLLDQSPNKVQPLVQQAYLASGQVTISNADDLRKLFVEAIQCFDKLVIVIDALDELDNFGLDVVAETLIAIQKSPTVTVKLFITSRNEVRVSDKLAFCHERIWIVKGDLEDDLSIFVTRALDENVQLRRLLTENVDFVQEIRATLIEESEGQFLLPKMVIQDLQPKQTISQMREVLRKTPRNLKAYYAYFFKRIDPAHKEFAHLAFRWAAYVKTPLCLADFAQALTHNELYNGGLCALNLSLSLQRSCGSLIQIEGAMIRLSHTSVQNFLLDSDDILLAEGLSDFIFSPESVHAEIASTCLACLLDPRFAKPIGGFRRFQKPTEIKLAETYPFLLYSARHWGSHLKGSKTKGSSALAKLQAFMNSTMCRTWIEAVFMSSHYPRAVIDRVLDNLMEWLREHEDVQVRSDIERWIAELWSFSVEYMPCLVKHPSEVHFIKDALPEVRRSPGLFPQYTIHQESAKSKPSNSFSTTQPSKTSNTFDLKLGNPRSDRFIWDGEILYDWDSTMTSISRRKYMDHDVQEKWYLVVQNALTLQNEERPSIRSCFFNGVCASTAVCARSRSIAVSWADIQDAECTEPLKIKTYAWQARIGNQHLPVLREWEWTDEECGVDYTRAAGFAGSKNTIAFSKSGDTLITPGGFYNVMSGKRTAPPSLFFNSNVHGLTFSRHGEFAWGTQERHKFVKYHRESGSTETGSNERWRRIEICGVSDSGQFAVALWQFHLSDPSGRAYELGIILRDGNTVSLWSKNRIIEKADEDSTSDAKGEKESKEAQTEPKKDNPQEENDKNFEIFHRVFANGGFVDSTPDGFVVIAWPTSPLTIFFGKVTEDGSALEIPFDELTVVLPGNVKPLSIFLRQPDVLVATTDRQICLVNLGTTDSDLEGEVVRTTSAGGEFQGSGTSYPFVVSDVNHENSELLVCSRSKCVTYSEDFHGFSKPLRIDSFSQAIDRPFDRLASPWLSVSLPLLTRNHPNQPRKSRLLTGRTVLNLLDKAEMLPILWRADRIFRLYCERDSFRGFTVTSKATNVVADYSGKTVSFQTLAILTPETEEAREALDGAKSKFIILVHMLEIGSFREAVFGWEREQDWTSLTSLAINTIFLKDTRSMIFSFGGILPLELGYRYYGHCYMCDAKAELNLPKPSSIRGWATEMKDKWKQFHKERLLPRELTLFGEPLRPLSHMNLWESSSGTELVACEDIGMAPRGLLFIDCKSQKVIRRMTFEAFAGDLYTFRQCRVEKGTAEIVIADSHLLLALIEVPIGSKKEARGRWVASITNSSNVDLPKVHIKLLEDGSARVIQYGTTLIRATNQQDFSKRGVNEDTALDVMPVVLSIPAQSLGPWIDFEVSIST